MSQKLLVPLVAALIVAAAGIGALGLAVHHDTTGRSPAKVASGSQSTSTPTSEPSEPSAAAPGAGIPGGPTPTTTGLSAPSTATTAKPGNGSPVTSTAPTSAVTRPSTSGSSGPAPTRTGAYTYTNASTGVPGTLVISGSGGQENWARNMGSNSFDTSMLFNSSGVFVQTLTALGTTCAFATPVAWPPWPVTPGRTFTGQASCSTGNATVAVAGQVAGPAVQVTLGDGSSVSTFIVNSVITVNASGNPPVTVAQSEWYAPSLRLPVKTHTVIAAISSDETYLLRSANPT